VDITVYEAQPIQQPNVTRRRECWVVVYCTTKHILGDGTRPCCTGSVYLTREDAERDAIHYRDCDSSRHSFAIIHVPASP
jgi:hypothetical protein